MRDLFSDKMVVVISHRLTMTRDADAIVVLENGRICEKGSHRELLHHDGVYALYWHAQAMRYRERENIS